MIQLDRKKVFYSLMVISIFCLFNLPLLIKRGHTYAVIMLLLTSLIFLFSSKKTHLLKEDKYLIFTFIFYAVISGLIGFYHNESMKTIEHSLKFLLFIPIIFYLFTYPPTSLFIFICAGLGATNVGILALWNKFYLGIPRASDYLNPIIFAEVSLLLVVFCLCGLRLAPTIQSKMKQYLYSILLSFGVLGGLIAVILSASRGAWVVIPIILIGIVMLYRFTKYQALIFITASFLLLSSSYFIPQTGVKQRIHQAISAFQPKTKEFSVSARIEMWKTVTPMLKKHPVLGWGKVEANKEKQRLIKQRKAHKKLSRIGHWHNIFIEKAIKQGLLGLFALMCLFVVPLTLFIRTIQRNHSIESRTLAYCGVIIILSHMSFGISDLLLKYNIGTIFYCLPIILLWAVIRNNQQESNETTKVANQLSIVLYRRLLAYVKPHWFYALIMIIATGAYSATNAIYAAQLKDIIDEGFIKKDMGAINATIMILWIITLFRGVSFFISNYTMRRVSSDIVLNLRQDMFTKLQQLPTRYFDRVSTGKTLSKFNYDVLQVVGTATDAVIVLVREGVLSIVLLIYLLYQNWKLTLLIFALVPVISVLVKIISKRLRTLAERIQGNMGEMNHILDENIKGHKIVKVYAGQSHEIDKFSYTARQIRHASIKSEIVSSTSAPIMELLIISVISLIIWLMAREAKHGLLTPGEFMSYIVMIGLLPNPVKRLMRINEVVQRGLAACHSIFDFLDEEVEKNKQLTQPRQVLPDFSGELNFQHVEFGYDEEPILSDFNLHIKAGETVALVGASGSGKSSLASLIPRFYEISRGQITLDGISITDIDLSVLRKQIAFVNQDIVLFDDSVTHNIAYGQAEENINIEKVEQAAQLAHAEAFILNLESGYETFIGESGQRLSGGQKQRLAIARAIYKDSPIIILDEATSALDSESEHKVQLALDELMHDRTAIVIAHRLSTIQNADRIVVLDQGKIVEQGTHNELMASKGRYYHLNHSLIKDTGGDW